MNATMHMFLQDMESQLVNINVRVDMDEYTRMQLCVQQCEESIEVLKNYMWMNVFLSRKDEMRYFKVFKPRFLACLLYYSRIYGCPRTSNAAYMYWQQCISAIEEWQRVEHWEFYKYSSSGNSSRDGYYFTAWLCSRSDFSKDTDCYDHLVARILAGEWLHVFIMDHELTRRSN